MRFQENNVDDLTKSSKLNEDQFDENRANVNPNSSLKIPHTMHQLRRCNTHKGVATAGCDGSYRCKRPANNRPPARCKSFIFHCLQQHTQPAREFKAKNQ